jgi:hypothetical protein
MIKLVSIDNCSDAWDAVEMNSNPDIYDILYEADEKNFVNRYQSFLIKEDEENIGYVSLIFENYDYRFLFLDVGLKKEYQDTGIFNEVLEKIVKLNIPQYIIIKTSVKKVETIDSLKNRIKLLDIDGNSFYLLQNNRYQEFIAFTGLGSLVDHFYNEDRKKIK